MTVLAFTVALMLEVPVLAEMEEPGAILFSDDFDTPALFAENWNVRRGRPAPDGGKLRLVGDVLAMRRETPAEFLAEMKVSLLPEWAVEREPLGQFAGFHLGSLYFCIRPDGMTFVKRPQDGASYLRVPVEGYAHGKPQTLRVARKLFGPSATYAFWINGREIARFHAAAQLETPLEILAEHRHVKSLEAEIDDFVLYALVRGKDDSPNRIVNSGFEHVQEGDEAIFFHPYGFFDWMRPAEEYERDFVRRFVADTAVRHSGRRSMRMSISPCSDYYAASLVASRVEGAPLVYSVYLKTDRPGGAKAELQCCGKVKVVDVDGEWRRFEQAFPEPPGQWRSPAVVARNPQRERFNIWIDDAQLEAFPPDTDTGAASFYASPYRPSELDEGHFSPRSSAKPPENRQTRPRLRQALGTVLGRLDFYMDEPEAAWRVAAENGEIATVVKPMGEIPYGTNVVTFYALGRDYTDTVVRLPPRPGATQVNRWTRSLVHDGRPVLFTGLCLEPLSFGMKKPLEWYPRQLAFLREKGFRHYQTLSHAQKRMLDCQRACFEAGESLGFLHLNWCDFGVGLAWGWKGATDIDTDGMVEFFAPYTNIVSHMVLDEPELSMKDELPLARLREMKAKHPYTPVQMNNSVLGIPRRFANLETDILMVDDYLTNRHDGRTVESVVANLDGMLSAAPGKPCWLFLVGDNQPLHYRNPTYAEQVAQSWGALCSGATGISWYIGFPRTEGTWRAMVDVNREAQSLADVLLSEELCDNAECAEPWSAIRHLTRRCGDIWHVFSCNLDAAPRKNVKFQMPSDAPRDGTVEVLFENRTLKLRDGRFQDDFPAHFRHIYRMRR